MYNPQPRGNHFYIELRTDSLVQDDVELYFNADGLASCLEYLRHTIPYYDTYDHMIVNGHWFW